MKLSRKIKLYSSLASFAVLGGIAITAASCAETSSTEKSSSPETDNKQPAASEGSGGGQLVLNQQNLLKQIQAVLMATQKLVKKLDQVQLKLAAHQDLTVKILMLNHQFKLVALQDKANPLHQKKWVKNLLIQKTRLLVLILLALIRLLKTLYSNKLNKALIYFKFIV